MSIENQVQTLVEELKTNGYEVSEGPITDRNNPHNILREFTDFVSFKKLTGNGRRDINGGFLVFDEEGQVGFDVFKGGSKYGTHFNSNPEVNELYGMTPNPDLKGILTFLGV